MIRRGILGNLAAQIAAGEFTRQPELATSPFALDDITVEVDRTKSGLIDQAEIDREAQAIADAALAPLVAMAIEHRAAPADNDLVASIVHDHGDVFLQAAGYAALLKGFNGFIASALVDEARSLTGLPHLGNADRRHAVAFRFVELFTLGLGGIIAEVAQTPADLSGGLN